MVRPILVYRTNRNERVTQFYCICTQDSHPAKRAFLENVVNVSSCSHRFSVNLLQVELLELYVIESTSLVNKYQRRI